MGHIIRSGSGWVIRFAMAAAFIATFAGEAFGQSPTCNVAAFSPTLHSEGLAEQIGDISFRCSGGSGTVTALLVITLNANVTNRLDAGGNLTGITVTAPATVLNPPTLNNPNTLLFTAIQMPGASAVFTISGIRVAMPTVSGSGAPLFVNATVAGSNLNIVSQTLGVGVSAPTLLASVANYGVPCAGSPSPSTVDFPGLIAAQTSSSTVRVTEASATSFAPKVGTADSGIRFLISLSGYGPNARIFVPDVIVGNISPTPTTAGAFGSAVNGGTFNPNTNQVLLTRVNGADATGAGGTLFLASPPGSGQGFSSVSQVIMANGAGTVTYEVLVASPTVVDSAQIPVFVVAPSGNCAAPLANNLSVTLAPASNVSIPTQSDAIPRFAPIVPPSDCSVIGDCSSAYFPVLQVAPTAVTLTGNSLGKTQTAIVSVTDGGSQATQLLFTVSAAYQPATNQSVANWLSINGTPVTGAASTFTAIVDPVAGIPAFLLSLSASPAALLLSGAYQATVTINAGSAGTITVPVTFNVGPPGTIIQSVVNAANSQPGAISAGSFAAIYGLNLVPKTTAPPSVTFNGFPATISYDGQPTPSSPTQINVLVPAALGTAAVAGVVATIDGVASNTFPVNLVPNAPAVFNPGILNHDNSVNLASAAASRGDIIQVFFTGLATPIVVPLTVNIGNQALTGSQIIYAGAVPSISGLEQVNVQIPASLTFTGGSTPLTICVPAANGQATCSVPVNLYLK